jgi:hypothetical protein
MPEILRFPLVSGVREDSDPKALPPGSLLSGVNIRQPKAGVARKRRGVSSLGQGLVSSYAGSSITSGRKLLSRTGADLAIIGKLDNGTVATEQLLSYSDERASWNVMDIASPLMATWRPVADSVDTSDDLAVAYAGGRVYYAWATSDNVYLAGCDQETGAPLFEPELITGASLPRIFAIGSLVYVFYYSAATGDLAAKVFDPSVPGITSSTSYATLGNPVYDVVTDGTSFFMAYPSAMSNTVHTIKISVLTMTAGAPLSRGVASASYTGIAIEIDTTSTPATKVWVLASYGSETTGAGDTTLFVGDATPAATASTNYGVPAARDCILKYETNAPLVVGFTQMYPGGTASSSSGSTTYRYPATTFVANQLTGASLGQTQITYRARFLSKPWVQDGRAYVLMTTSLRGNDPTVGATGGATAHHLSTQRRAFVAEIERRTVVSAGGFCHSVVAVLDFAMGGTVNQPVQPATVSDTRTIVGCPITKDPIVQYEERPQGQMLVSLDTDDPGQHRQARIGPLVYVGGGAPCSYDGVRALPLGFLHEPMLMVSLQAVAGNMLSDAPYSSYYYTFGYEWLDAAGMLHRSALSAPVEIRLDAANGSVTLTVIPTNASCKHRPWDAPSTVAFPVRIPIFRTAQNGSTYYRRTVEPYAILENNPTVNSVTFLDDAADSDILFALSTSDLPLASQEQPYTEGGVLDAMAPPSFVDICTHRERVYGISGGRRTVYASTAISEDPMVAPYFNEALAVYFDADKFALGSLDGRLVAFDERGFDILDGDGPDLTGGARDWRTTRVQSDVGCTNPCSVVSMPNGLMFQSTSGRIMMLSRGLEVVWVGRDVQDQLETYPRVTSATLVAADHEVRFTCTNEDGTTGAVLVFDYEHKAWYTRTYPSPFVDAQVIDGAWTALTAEGVVYRETDDTALDNGVTFVASEYVFAPILPNGPTGWGRLKAVQIIGSSRSNHDLMVQVARDHDAAYEQTATFVAPSSVTAVGSHEVGRMDLAIQKGIAFQFRVADSAPSSGALGSGEGLQLEGLALLVTPKPGALAQLNEARRR